MTTPCRKTRYLVTKKTPKGKSLHYWQPSKALRSQGFLTRRLSDDLLEATTQAEQLNREVDKLRSTDFGEKPLNATSTVSELIQAYKKDPLFYEKRPATQRIYGQCLTKIDRWAGDQEFRLITRALMIDFHRELYLVRPAFANSVGRMMRIIFEFAYDRGLIDQNPARKLKMQSRPPRTQVWSLEDQAQFVTKALEMGYPSMALAVKLGACTAQRQADILHLCWHQVDDTVIRLRQRKTNQWVVVPMLRKLKNALDTVERHSEFVVVSEATGRPYKPDHFRHLFRDIANQAEIADLEYRDLRRTAIVRMAEAGLTAPQITAISGHDISQCERILETYMPRNETMAREAILHFEKYIRREAKKNKK